MAPLCGTSAEPQVFILFFNIFSFVMIIIMNTKSYEWWPNQSYYQSYLIISKPRWIRAGVAKLSLSIPGVYSQGWAQGRGRDSALEYRCYFKYKWFVIMYQMWSVIKYKWRLPILLYFINVMFFAQYRGKCPIYPDTNMVTRHLLSTVVILWRTSILSPTMILTISIYVIKTKQCDYAKHFQQ